MDAKMIREELGISAGAAEAIMRSVEKTRVGRRVYVKRADVDAYIAANTVPADGLRRTA